ncbi:hypothetical protein OPKNFCMD_3500 [Methylobacterium crusticola]|uniref:Lipoprotein n=1 Tax=Methylobacterium crusticola TaxID=1697972 RepID=A0ABQ4R1B7_9HYPH|nr:hypothetical protein [Methylobacterium crusticola]GJD50755.1 hypothetical protein OPKNFCMD_3500 [Methylobacterium crusticola]
MNPRLLALAGLVSLTACAAAVDPEQARTCRRVLPTLVPAGERVQVLRTAPAAQPRSVRIDFAQERDGRATTPRFAVCRFSEFGRADLAEVTSDRGAIGGAALYLLKHYYLDTPDAARAEPGAG